jgi:hypothetical protein
MNRRAFFSSIAAIAATATLDPEKLLWRPGAKLISIPREPASQMVSVRAIHRAVSEEYARVFASFEESQLAHLERLKRNHLFFSYSPHLNRLTSSSASLPSHPAADS